MDEKYSIILPFFVRAAHTDALPSMVTLVLTVSRSLVSTPGVFGILFRLGEQKKTLGAHRLVSENLTDACGVGQLRDCADHCTCGGGECAVLVEASEARLQLPILHACRTHT